MAIDSNEGGGSDNNENGCSGALDLFSKSIKFDFGYLLDTQLAKAWVQWILLVQKSRLISHHASNESDIDEI